MRLKVNYMQTETLESALTSIHNSLDISVYIICTISLELYWCYSSCPSFTPYRMVICTCAHMHVMTLAAGDSDVQFSID